jgi:tetratricopeptide (TPR) repeat protein
MKKFLFSAVAVLFCLGLSAQDVKKIRNAYDKKDWPKAKEAVDLALANEKEQKNWEAWYYKGLIYGQIAKDANLKATVPDAWVQSFEAYQKAMELDKKQAEIFMMTRQYPVFENYLELQKEANAFYNSGNYQGALDGYKKADKVGRFIFANKWALSEVDTILYYYAGAAAMQLENKDEVIYFFQKIADANIGGEGYDVVYRYLTYYYDQKKNTELATKYAEAGRKLYPKDMYYDRLELDKMRKSGASAQDIFKKYETIIAGDPKDYELRYDYAAEIFNWLYMDSKATAEQKPEYYGKIISTLKTSIEIDPKQPDAHLLLGKTYFNEAAFMQDEMKKIKGTTPADTQKKTDMKKQMEEKMKEALPHLDNSLAIYAAMTADQLKDKRTKNEYKSTLYLLTEAHRFLGNKDKEKEFDTKYQALNQ